MTSLSKLIMFRSLMDQLSKKEFTQFMSKIFDDNKTNLIATSLFNHFTQSANNNHDQLNNVNSILSNIIQSRKVKPKPFPTTNIKFDQLPLQIIGHTASFLDQSSYLRLQKINRSAFMGCNGPNMLKKLDLINITDYKSINLNQYRSLKQLYLNIRKFNELPLPNNGQFIMNELDDLLLDAKHANDCDIEAFMNQNCINIENIKTLRLRRFGDIPERKQFDADKFWRILTKFPNIEYLELCNIYRGGGIDPETLKQIYPNLKGLIVNAGNREVNNRLVNMYGNDLCFLYHSNGHSDWKDVNFNKLQQLVLDKPDMNTINDILKTARNLQKVCIVPFKQNEDELKTVIPQILKCKSLEYLKIDTKNDKQCAAILEGIEIGLYETKQFERKHLKINVCSMEINDDIDIKRTIFNIGKSIHCLETSEIKNFMFIWDLENIKNTEFGTKLNKKEILNQLRNISPNVQIVANGLRFVMMNKKSEINGWSESWLM